MKAKNSVLVTTVNKAGEVIEEQKFVSVVSCCRFYQIGPSTFQHIIAGTQKRLIRHLPENIKFELIPPIDERPVKTHSDKSPKDYRWFCDLCQQEYRLSSRVSHLYTIKHRTKVLEAEGRLTPTE